MFDVDWRCAGVRGLIHQPLARQEDCRTTGQSAPDVLMTESFAQMFEESLASQKIKPGSILTGRIVEVGEDFVIVNAGLKSEAVISSDQFKNDRGEIEVSCR